MRCAVCDEPLPERARFCPNCGAAVASLAGTEERRMVTVLFADLVGSTDLTRRLDPERVREIFARFFDAASEALRALRGRPEKFIGDAVMAVFGLPAAHEDDALRAVRAGLAIRARVRRLGEATGLADGLRVRVGIESGEAAVGLGPVGQMLVTGTVVHAAARLQTAAQPGEVLIGETTHALTADETTHGEPRTVSAKGFDGGLVARPVEGISPRTVRRTIPLVGRASELATLQETLDVATRTGHPVLATIVGEPGMGKSRLAQELVASVGEDVAVLAGRARSLGDTATFAPAAAIVGELAGLREGAGTGEIGRRLADLVASWASPPGDEEGASRAAERLALLFGTAVRRDESAFVQDVQAGFLAAVDAAARERPALLVFEDAHTLKGPMLDLIERLAAPGRAEPRRAMVLVLGRPELLEARPDWASRAANAVTLRLDPLSLEQSVELVRQAAGGRIEGAEAVVIAERAGGNPYFIIETTGMLLREEGTGETAARPPLPLTVRAVVSARLDALPPRLRDLARRASAFFVSFDLDELHTVDPEATREEIRHLEEAEVLVPEAAHRGPERWRLRHTTLKEVAYASLPKRERVRLHQIVADRLLATGHPSWAADHLELAALASLDLEPEEREVPDRAADALVGAGDRARRRMESRSAIDYYRRGLSLAGPEDRWSVREARALAGAGEAHYWLGEYPAAVDALERAVGIGTGSDDAFALALALRFLGDIAINVDADLDRAEELFDRSLAAAEELGDHWVIARTLLFAGWVPWTRERMDEAEAIWRRALAVADPDDGWARVRALNSLSINRTGGPSTGPPSTADAEEALRLSREARALAEQIGDAASVAMTTVQQGRVMANLGRLDQALNRLTGAAAAYEELGMRWELADAVAERGIVLRRLGRLDEAEADLRRAIRISEELGERQLGSWTWRALARVSEQRGDRSLAEEQLRRARQAEEAYRRARHAGRPPG